MKRVREKNPFFKGKFDLSKVVMIIVALVLLAFVLSMFYVVFWTFTSSLKDEINYTLDTLGLPTSLHFENYLQVWDALQIDVLVGWTVRRFDIPSMLFYTLVITISGTAKTIFGNLQIAYILAKCKNRFANFLWTYMIVMMFVPLGPSLVVQLKFAKWLGYWDNLPFYCMWGWGCFGANTLLLYGSFKGVPDAYGEAAKIDGAGPFRIFWQIYVPQILPMVAVLFVLALVGCLDDYNQTVVWLPSYPMLGYGLYYFKGQAQIKGIGRPVLLAAYAIIGLISAIMYLSTQNLILTKMSVGTLKQ